MTNVILWIGLILATFGGTLLAYYLFGKVGLLTFAGAAIILANIQVVKTIELFGIVATLGNVVYSASFLLTDALGELYDKKQAKVAVFIGFFSALMMIIITQLSIYFNPHSSDFAHEAMVTIFSIIPRITVASLIAYLVSQLHDVWAYAFWKKKFSKKNQIWIRNNASTFISQLLDTLLFTSIAFIGVFPMSVVIEIGISTYVLKWLIAVSDTPFIYLIRWMKDNGHVAKLLPVELAAEVE